MINQIPKQVIDTGLLGNPATGDILHDGGVKANENFTGIYNAFGDQRFSVQNTAEGNQTIHATGYWQKSDQYTFNTPIAIGTQWDIDTKLGSANPILGPGKAGECVNFVNSNGSISVSTPLVIQASSGSFVGVQGPLVITTPFVEVKCWCTKVEAGIATWDYSISSMFGERQTAIDDTIRVSTAETKVRLAHASEFQGLKLFITAANVDNSKMRQSESNLLIDNTGKRIYDTEFAVIKVGHTSETDEIVSIKYEIDSNGYINMLVKSTYTGIKLAIKSVITQKIGTA